MPSDVRGRIAGCIKIIRVNCNCPNCNQPFMSEQKFDVEATATAILSVIGGEIEGMKEKLYWEEEIQGRIVQYTQKPRTWNEALTDLRARLEK